MPAEKTRADSLRLYLSGAASDGGAQANHNAALGNYRSSTEISVLGATITSPISNVTVLYAAGENGTGQGSLAATGVNELAWTPPGGTQGTPVSIANGETKVLEGGGAEGPNKFLRVSRTSTADLTGTATITLAEVVNNAVGFDNVSSAEAAAGDNEFRGIFVKNESSNTVAGLTVHIGTLGTQQTTGTAQLGGAGGGTITTAGSFADWPDSGFAHIKTSGGSTREIVYYSSRTSSSLTVPAAGRGLLGTSAGAGNGTDTIDAVPGIRIAKEAPAGNASTGNVQTIANEGTAPSGASWNTGISAGTGVSIGDLAAGNIYGLWIHRAVVVGQVARASVLHLLRLSFDAA